MATERAIESAATAMEFRIITRALAEHYGMAPSAAGGWVLVGYAGGEVHHVVGGGRFLARVPSHWSLDSGSRVATRREVAGVVEALRTAADGFERYMRAEAERRAARGRSAEPDPTDAATLADLRSWADTIANLTASRATMDAIRTDIAAAGIDLT